MFREIKIAFFDVDGVLTDGIYQLSEDGSVTKSFYTRDFYGLEQLMRNGITVVIITQSHDEVFIRQIERICSNSTFWDSCFVNGTLIVLSGIDNKKEEIEHFFTEGVVGWDNISYMGDAENDLECIKLARFSGCPTDAIPDVRTIAMYPSDYYGGKGAVHDFCNYILEKKGEK